MGSIAPAWSRKAQSQPGTRLQISKGKKAEIPRPHAPDLGTWWADRPETLNMAGWLLFQNG